MEDRFAYEPIEELIADDFAAGFANWHHEGIGEIAQGPEGGMELHCFGSRQSGEGCMAFLRPDLPDQVSIEYDVVIKSQGGLVINYLAMRGLLGEDMITDTRLAPRTGIMANYWSRRWGLQSYHISYSRFRDTGEHTNTSNWRRNPGCYLMAVGEDHVCELNRRFTLRVVKDYGYLAFYVDGTRRFGFVDRDTTNGSIPDWGKFGFRLIGSDVKVEVFDFKAHRVRQNEKVWAVNEV
jgi:hypothetical protein